MSDIAVRVENLSKRYRLGEYVGYKTLRESLTNVFSAPFRRLTRSNPSVVQSSGSDVSDAALPAGSGPSRYIWALKDVSFEVKQGEAVGIIGKNGSGKSTLLKILSRITSPTEGSVEIHGRAGALLEVGTGFHPELTGRENIYLNGAVLGMKKAEVERKLGDIVDFAEIGKFLDTPVKHYSSGMYLRLAFAVAAHLEPDILIVDEVLAVGDAQFQKKCLGKMGNVANEGRTVLFVSHNMAAVRSLCSHAVLLENGRITMVGPTESVVTKYLSESASKISPVVPLPSGSPNAPGVGLCLRFLARDRTPQAQFRIGEPWRIVLDFEASASIEHAIAAVGLVSFGSVPIITYWSKPRDLRQGLYSVEFECDLPLASGDLEFAVGLSSHERTVYFAQGVGRVTISDVAQREQPIRATGAGLLSSFCRPEITPLKR